MNIRRFDRVFLRDHICAVDQENRSISAFLDDFGLWEDMKERSRSRTTGIHSANKVYTNLMRICITEFVKDHREAFALWMI